jgi:hypothetical protein
MARVQDVEHAIREDEPPLARAQRGRHRQHLVEPARRPM